MASENIGELIVRIEADLKDFEKGIDKMQKKTKGFGDILNNALSFAGGLGIVKGVEKIVDGLTSGVKMGIDFNSTMQQNKIAFDSMLGSAEKADKLLGELSKMAAATPFEFPELTTAAKKMLAFGFAAEKIPGMMKNIGDAAAGLGLGAEGVSRITIALGQMQAKQKIQAGEVLQLTEAGIPALDILAKHFGKTTAEISQMQEKGLLPVQESIDALIAGMGSRFPNMMDKQSKSFAGLMSTLKDNIQMTFGQILKPAFEYATNTLLPMLIDKTSLFQSKFQETGNLLTAVTATMGIDFVNASSSIINSVQPIIDRLTNLYEKVLPNLQNIFNVTTSETIPSLTNSFNSFVNNVLPPITDLFLSIYEKLIPPVIKVFEFLYTEIVPKLAKSFSSYMPIIGEIMTNLKGVIIPIVDAIVKEFETYWPVIKEIVSIVVDGVSGAIKGLLEILNGLLIFMKGVFSGNLETIKQGLITIFGGIGDALGSALKMPILLAIDAINAAIRGLNSLKFTIPDWIPEIGGNSFGLNIPEIPKFADGVKNFSGGAAIVGEQGPELVNLPKGSDVIPNNKIQGSLGNINYEEMFKGAIFNVRSDNDIKMIAREIYNLQQQRGRANGLATT